MQSKLDKKLNQYDLKRTKSSKSGTLRVLTPVISSKKLPYGHDYITWITILLADLVCCFLSDSVVTATEIANCSNQEDSVSSTHLCRIKGCGVRHPGSSTHQIFFVLAKSVHVKSILQKCVCKVYSQWSYAFLDLRSNECTCARKSTCFVSRIIQ